MGDLACGLYSGGLEFQTTKTLILRTVGNMEYVTAREPAWIWTR